MANVYDAISCAFEDLCIPEARRSIALVDVTRISDSCGYGVSLMEMVGARDDHALSSAMKVRVNGLDGYREINDERNSRSVDGLPAL